MITESALLNVVFPFLLVVQIGLLIISACSRKEILFLATLVFGGLCVAYIRFFIDARGGFLFGGLERQLFFLIMPCLFRIVAIITFVTRSKLACKMSCRLPWAKVFNIPLSIAFALDLFCIAIPWFLDRFQLVAARLAELMQ